MEGISPGFAPRIRHGWFLDQDGLVRRIVRNHTPLLVLHRRFGRCSSNGSRPHSELDDGPEFARVSLATITQIKLIERYRTRYRVYATKVANQKDMSRYSWIMESYVALRLLRSRRGSLLELALDLLNFVINVDKVRGTHSLANLSVQKRLD